MRNNYLGGNYGYGHAKQALFELVLDKFKVQRSKYAHFMEHPNEIEVALKLGANKAKAVARPVLDRVRQKLGFQSLS
jgi:tryptophanyl-tRNA synthetase